MLTPAIRFEPVLLLFLRVITRFRRFAAGLDVMLLVVVRLALRVALPLFMLVVQNRNATLRVVTEFSDILFGFVVQFCGCGSDLRWWLRVCFLFLTSI